MHVAGRRMYRYHRQSYTQISVGQVRARQQTVVCTVESRRGGEAPSRGSQDKKCDQWHSQSHTSTRKSNTQHTAQAAYPKQKQSSSWTPCYSTTNPRCSCVYFTLGNSLHHTRRGGKEREKERVMGEKKEQPLWTTSYNSWERVAQLVCAHRSPTIGLIFGEDTTLSRVSTDSRVTSYRQGFLSLIASRHR